MKIILYIMISAITFKVVHASTVMETQSISVIESTPETCNLQLKPQHRKVYCWYGYQEKLIALDSKTSMPIVKSVLNYSTEIMELTVPNIITDNEVAQIVNKHITQNCPIKEKNGGADYYYYITGKFGPNISSTKEGALHSLKSTLGNSVTFSMCSFEALQESVLKAQHYSYDDPNKSGINLYCVAYWYKINFNPVSRVTYVAQPTKINCVSGTNKNVITQLLEKHIKNNCSVPEGFIVGVSSMGTYQEALDYIQEQFPNALLGEICSLDLFQELICNNQ